MPSQSPALTPRRGFMKTVAAGTAALLATRWSDARAEDQEIEDLYVFLTDMAARAQR